MNIAIVGFDREGRASLEFLQKQRHNITICDQNTELIIPDGVNSRLGEAYLDELDTFDLIVRTPGLHPSKILAKNPRVGRKITSGTNLFFENSPTKNIIGVTGTKGKGTTSTLVSHILKTAGKDVYLGGNIGVPILSFIDKLTPESWVVIELSSFQLLDIKYSPRIGCVLMVVPEHLDWHEDFEEYIAAKQQLFIHQTEDDTAIYYSGNENSVSIADASEGVQIPYFEKPGAVIDNGAVVIDGNTICQTSELKLIGKHNWQNVCAAVTAVWQVTQDVEAIRTAVINFSGLPYRIEFRREVGSVRYFNDSFASGPGAAIAAMQSIPGMKVLIIGGYDRMLDLSELSAAIQQNAPNIRKIVLIGAAADRVAELLDKENYANYTHCRAKTMDEIVAAATAEAKDGDAVVLSPSFASFDLFKNFEDRGDKFNEAVSKL